MGNVIHESVDVMVKVRVDVGIADMVRYLQTIPGVYTIACCQGTIGEGGPAPYRAYVSLCWPDQATFERLCDEFDYDPDPDRNGNQWGCFHPKAVTADPRPKSTRASGAGTGRPE